jgi:hypothetical protein
MEYWLLGRMGNRRGSGYLVWWRSRIGDGRSWDKLDERQSLPARDFIEAIRVKGCDRYRRAVNQDRSAQGHSKTPALSRLI